MSKKIKKIQKAQGNISLKDNSVKKKNFNKKKTGAGFFRRVADFIKELKGELKKVVWPTRKNLIISTFVVILAIILMAIFVMFADYIFRGILKALLKSL